MKNTKQQAELIRYERSPVAMNSLELLLNEARIDERKKLGCTGLISFGRNR